MQLGSQTAFVALSVRYLGAEQFGVWMALIALFGVSTIATFGIGPGLVNALAEANGSDDKDKARALFTAAFFSMTLIAVILFLMFVGLAGVVSWASLINAPAQDAREVAWTASILAFFLFAQFPLGLVESTYTAYQESYISYAWKMISQVVSIAILATVVQFKPTLPFLVLSYSGSLFLITLISGVWMVTWHRPYLLPQLSALRRWAVARVMRSASGFLLLTAAGLLVTQGVTLIVTQSLGPASVASYSIVWRMITLTNGFVAMFAVPLWGAYGEARVRKDWAWVVGTHNRLIYWVAIFSLGAFGLLAFVGKDVVQLWTGGVVKPSAAFIAIMCAYGAAQAINTGNGALVSGFDLVVRLGLVAILDALLAVTLVACLVRYYGLEGVAAGLLTATLVVSTWFLRTQARRLCQRMGS